MKRLIYILLPLLLFSAAFGQFKATEDFKATGGFKVSSSTGGASTTLTNGLTAFWKMDSTATTPWEDSIGSLDLTNNNNVSDVSGKIGQAGQFLNASDQTLSRADSSIFYMDGQDLFAGWVYLYDVSGFRIAFGKVGDDADGWWVDADDRGPYFRFLSNNGSYDVVQHSISIEDSTWYFVAAWDDTLNDKTYLMVNTTLDSTAYTGNVENSSGAFVVGGVDRSTYDGREMNGIVDAVGKWERIPTAANGYAMLDSLYNGGTGWEPD